MSAPVVGFVSGCTVPPSVKTMDSPHSAPVKTKKPPPGDQARPPLARSGIEIRCGAPPNAGITDTPQLPPAGVLDPPTVARGARPKPIATVHPDLSRCTSAALGRAPAEWQEVAGRVPAAPPS